MIRQEKSVQKYLSWGYLILICTFLPLYMKEGYFELGEAKGIAFLIISGIFAVLFLLIKNKKIPSMFKATELIDLAALAFLFSNVISFAFSIDKKVSFLGLKGWRTGLLSVVLLFTVYLCYMELEEINSLLVIAALITPCFEFIVGILNRFGIYITDVYGRNSSFLATLGNINWYVGYLSVFVPLGIGICYTRKVFSKEFFLSGVYSYLGLTALFLQGSDSALLILAGTFIPLFFISLEKRQDFKRFLLMMGILGLSMETVCLLKLFAGRYYNYEDSHIMGITGSHQGLIIMAAAFFIYRLTRLFEEIKADWRGKLFFKIASIVLIAGVAIFIFGLIRSFDYRMGNGRGLIWSISMDMYNLLFPWQKMVGVGQDGFYTYAYSHPEITDSLLNVFPGNILTNAHCELLTMLIERGMLGVFTYLILMGTAISIFYKNKRKSAAVICALPIVAYFFNNLVSFSTAVSTPYIFILLGMGIGLCRHEND